MGLMGASSSTLSQFRLSDQVEVMGGKDLSVADSEFGHGLFSSTPVKLGAYKVGVAMEPRRHVIPHLSMEAGKSEFQNRQPTVIRK